MFERGQTIGVSTAMLYEIGGQLKGGFSMDHGGGSVKVVFVSGFGEFTILGDFKLVRKGIRLFYTRLSVEEDRCRLSSPQLIKLYGGNAGLVFQVYGDLRYECDGVQDARVGCFRVFAYLSTVRFFGFNEDRRSYYGLDGRGSLGVIRFIAGDLYGRVLTIGGGFIAISILDLGLCVVKSCYMAPLTKS